MICSSLRPRRGCGVGLPCAQSLLSAAGKCKPFRRSAFLTKLSAPSLIFPRGVLFSHIFRKRKNSHKRASFFFWKPASTYSPGHVSASYIALFFTAPQNVRRVARPSRDVFLLRRKNLSAPVLRVLIKLSVRSLIFPPQIVYLAVHGKSFPLCTKQKHPTDVECFCFGNRRRRVVICSSLRPRRGCGVGLPCAQSLLSAAGKCKPFRRSAFLTKLSAPSLIFPRGVLFSHIFRKRKNSHKRASFFFWKPASTYSPGPCPAKYHLRG